MLFLTYSWTHFLSFLGFSVPLAPKTLECNNSWYTDIFVVKKKKKKKKFDSFRTPSPSLFLKVLLTASSLKICDIIGPYLRTLLEHKSKNWNIINIMTFSVRTSFKLIKEKKHECMEWEGADTIYKQLTVLTKWKRKDIIWICFKWNAWDR